MDPMGYMTRTQTSCTKTFREIASKLLVRIAFQYEIARFSQNGSHLMTPLILCSWIFSESIFNRSTLSWENHSHKMTWPFLNLKSLDIFGRLPQSHTTTLCFFFSHHMAWSPNPIRSLLNQSWKLLGCQVSISMASNWVNFPTYKKGWGSQPFINLLNRHPN